MFCKPCAYTAIALLQPSQANEQKAAQPTRWVGLPQRMPWSRRRGLPGSGICIFLDVLISSDQETIYKTIPGLIERGFRRSSRAKPMIHADHHSDWGWMAWKAYASIGTGVADNLERLGEAFVQRSSRGLYSGAERRGRNLQTAVSFVVQPKRGLRDVREKRNIKFF